MKNKLLGVAATALAAVTVGVAIAPDANAQATTRWSGSPRTEEEDRRFKVNGRIHYDVFNHERDFENPATLDESRSGSFARRAFIGVEGQFTNEWRYNVKFDLAPSNSSADAGGEVKLDDAYLEYAGEDFSIFIGQNNAISHLEDRTSSNYIPFIERSLINQVSGYTKTFGVATLFSGGNWSLGGGVYTDSLNDPAPALNAGGSSNETLRFQARGTWAPVYQRTPDGVTLLHLGLSARHRDDGSSAFNFGSFRPNTNSLSGVGSFSNNATAALDGEDTYGAEVAFQWNAFGATAEYMTFNGNSGAGATDPEVNGYYVDLFWSPTGESRNYTASDGSFGRITPRASLGSDGIGHIMLSARYESLDATDTGIAAANRAETTGYLLGVTWAPIGYVKFMLNYGDYDREVVGANNDVEDKVVSFRTQFDW